MYHKGKTFFVVFLAIFLLSTSAVSPSFFDSYEDVFDAYTNLAGYAVFEESLTPHEEAPFLEDLFAADKPPSSGVDTPAISPSPQPLPAPLPPPTYEDPQPKPQPRDIPPVKPQPIPRTTPKPQPVPLPQPAPTPAPAPQPEPCLPVKVAWDRETASVGDTVTLLLTTQGNCQDSYAFDITEEDIFIIREKVTTLYGTEQANQILLSFTLTPELINPLFEGLLEGEQVELRAAAYKSDNIPVAISDVQQSPTAPLDNPDKPNIPPVVGAAVSGQQVDLFGDLLDQADDIGSIATPKTPLPPILGKVSSGLLLVTKGGPSSMGGPLADDQVFIRNNGKQPRSNAIAMLPVTFKQGEHTATSLANLRLKDIGTEELQITQAQITSRHADGSARTAVLYTLETLPAASEAIYQLVTDTVPQDPFVFHPTVQQFLSKGEIKAISRDLDGNDYVANIPLTSLTPYVDGSVMKKYRYVKTHDATSSSHPMDGLFTSVFEIEIASKQPFINVKHFVVNARNLKEDRMVNTRTYEYEKGQFGEVKYKNIELFMDSKESTNPIALYVPFLSNSLQPTRIETKGLPPNAKRVWVMPTDGQDILVRDHNKWEHHAPGPNYIGASQGFVTDVTIFTGTNEPRDNDPLYDHQENFVGGQGLIRYNDAGSVFSQIPSPEHLGEGKRFDLNKMAAETFGKARGGMAGQGYRFGLAGIWKFDVGSAGYSGVNDNEPRTIIHYILSCNSRCDPRFLEDARTFKYGAAHTGDIVPGFEPAEHSGYTSYAYRFPRYPRCSNKDDDLGYCQIKTPKKFESPHGHRKWTTFDDAHGQPALGLKYYELTGDGISHYVARGVYNPNVGHFNAGMRGKSSGFQPRALGRGLLAMSQMHATSDNIAQQKYLVTTIEGTLKNLIDNRIDKSAPGSRGNHEITGDPYPVGFLGTFYNGDGKPGSLALRSMAWHYAKIGEGVSYAYRNVPIGSSSKALAQELATKITDTLFTYAYKEPEEVSNLLPAKGKDAIINEGSGYFTNTIVIGPPRQGWGPKPSCCSPSEKIATEACKDAMRTRVNVAKYCYCEPGDGPICHKDGLYTKYGGAFTDYHFPGICNALQYVISSSHPKKSIWEQQLKRAFIAGKVYGVSNNDASQYAHLRGLNVHGPFNDFLCPITYSIGIPTAKSATTAFEDKDGDGFSVATGDCNDDDNTMYPSASETRNGACFDDKDNNCNGLVDCDDPQCNSNSYSGNFCKDKAPQGYCGNWNIENPNSEGRKETCDVRYGGGENPCVDGQCVVANVYAEGKNCFCKALPKCGDNRRNQPSEQCDGIDKASCGPNACLSTCLCDGPVLDLIDPRDIDYDTAQKSGSATLTAKGDNLVQRMSVKLNSKSEPRITLTYVSKKEITLTIPFSVIKDVGVGNHKLTLRDLTASKDTRTLDLFIGRAPQITKYAPLENSRVSNQEAIRLEASIQDNDPLDVDFFLKKVGEKELKNVKALRGVPSGDYNYIETAKRINLEGDLKRYYKFDETDRIADHSGNNQHVKRKYGTPEPRGLFAQSYSFDGKGFTYGPPLSTHGVMKFTAETWVKPAARQTAAKSGYAFVFGQEGHSFAFRIELKVDGDKLYPAGRLGYPDEPYKRHSTRYVTSSSSITPNEWHHIALAGDAQDDKKLRLYVDGKEVASIPWDKMLTASVNYEMTIGGIDKPTAGNYIGEIDETLFYKRTLADAEIKAHALPHASWPEGQYEWKFDVKDAVQQRTTGVVPFTMTGGPKRDPPTLGRLDPSTITNDKTIIVTATGNKFSFPGGVVLVNGDVYKEGQVISDTTAKITVVKDTPEGVYQISIRNTDNQESNRLPFTVKKVGGKQNQPKITSVNPSQVDRNQANVVQIIGENFLQPAFLFVEGHLLADSLHYMYMNPNTVVLRTPQHAEKGTYRLQVLTPYGLSNPYPITLGDGPQPPLEVPTIDRVSPETVYTSQGKTLVQLFGRNFNNAMAIGVENKFFYPTNLYGRLTDNHYLLIVPDDVPPGTYDLTLVTSDFRHSKPFTLTVNK